jgi:hypothetical protein
MNGGQGMMGANGGMMSGGRGMIDGVGVFDPRSQIMRLWHQGMLQHTGGGGTRM